MPVHPLNAFAPIEITVFGIANGTSLLIELYPFSNALSPIVSILLPILNEMSAAEHPENA